MENRAERKSTCTSVFKDGSTSTARENCTNAWIKLINRIEKNKQALR